MISKIYEGTEMCCNCGNDFDFVFVPKKSIYVTCPHCNTKQHPCSMCYECDNCCKENLEKFANGEYGEY